VCGRVPAAGAGWAGGPPFLLLLVSVPGKRGRERVRRRSAPADRECGTLGACLPCPARPVMPACVRAIGLDLGCPFDDQASATYCFGFVSSPYAKETLKPRLRVGLASWLRPGHGWVVHSMNNRRLLCVFYHLSACSACRIGARAGSSADWRRYGSRRRRAAYRCAWRTPDRPGTSRLTSARTRCCWCASRPRWTRRYSSTR
jgi:hypothetical protein